MNSNIRQEKEIDSKLFRKQKLIVSNLETLEKNNSQIHKNKKNGVFKMYKYTTSQLFELFTNLINQIKAIKLPSSVEFQSSCQLQQLEIKDLIHQFWEGCRKVSFLPTTLNCQQQKYYRLQNSLTILQIFLLTKTLIVDIQIILYQKSLSDINIQNMQAILIQNKFLWFVFILEYQILSQNIRILTLMENEQVLLRNQQIVISIDDQFVSELQSFQDKKYDLILSKALNKLEIFELYSQKQIERINSFSKVFTCLNYSTQFLQVWVLAQNSISLHFEVENTLWGEESIYLHQKSRQIQLHHQNCHQFNQVYNNIFLILCDNDMTSESLLQLIDSEGAIIDTKIFKINNDCKQSFEVQVNIIIYYEAKCQNFQVIIISIDFNKLLFEDESKNITDMFIKNGYENLKKILNCKNEKIILVFSNAVVHFVIQNFQIIRVLNLNNKNCLRFFANCQVDLSLAVIFSSQFNQQPKFEFLDNCSPNLIIDPSDQIQKHEIVNENALILVNNKLIGYNNIFYNQTLDGIIDFTFLGKLPYIVSISNTNKLQIIKINQFSKLITTKKNETVMIIKKSQLFLDFQGYELIKVQKYNITSLELLVVEKKTTDEFYLKEQKLVLNDFSLSQPLKAIDIFSEVFSLQIDNNMDEYPFKIGKNQTFINYKMQFNEETGLIIFYQIYDQITSSYQLFLKQCERNVSQQSLFIQKSDLRYNIFKVLPSQYIATNDNKLLYIAISTAFKIHQKQFQFSKIILNVQGYKRAVSIIFYDGTELCFLIPQIEIMKFEQCQSEEIIAFQFSNSKIGDEMEINPLNNSQLIINIKGFFEQILTFQGQITHFHFFEKPMKQLLVTTLLSNHEVRLLLYGKEHKNMQYNHLYRFLYEVPLYGFELITPLIINFDGQYFHFVAREPKNQSNYLMIYDSNRNAVQSLVFITEVDLHIFIVSYFSSGAFIYYSNEKLIYRKMFSEVYSVKLNNIVFDNRTIEGFIKLNVQSVVSNTSKNIMIEYNYFNTDVSLRFKSNVQVDQGFLSLQNTTLVGLEKIFGQIDEIKISQNCQGSLQNPIQLTNEFRECEILIGQLCKINDQILIYDPFGKNMKYYLHNNNEFIIGVFFQKHILIVFTYNQSNRLNVFIFLEANSVPLIRKEIYPKFSFYKYLGGEQKKYILTQTNEILYGEYTCVIFIFKLDQLKDFGLVAEYYFEKGKQQRILYLQDISNDNVSFYFQLLLNIKELRISLIQINKYRNFDIQFSDQQILNIGFLVISFQVKNVSLSGSILSIKLILKALLYNKYNYVFYEYQFQFDLNSQLIINGAITQYFRLLVNQSSNQIIIMDKIVIYQAINFNKPLLFIFPSQGQTESYSITDYFYSYQILSQSLIQQYNLTHLVFYNYDTKLYQLVRIDFYHLLLENLDENCQISLFNDVSTLKVDIKVKDISEQKLFLFFIIGMNLALIILLPKMRRKQRNRLRR